MGLMLIWATWRWRFSPASTIGLSVITAAATWGLLYLAFIRFPAEVGESSAFESAAIFTRDVPQVWLNRELAWRHGWLCGLVFYFLCWGIAKALPARGITT